MAEGCDLTAGRTVNGMGHTKELSEPHPAVLFGLFTFGLAVIATVANVVLYYWG
jgi:hypothetical protein